ncbi:hypothetical protein L3X38_045524 [Prunus dulcis]|uniref:C-JID domain-containing protein n=1 Tax=Prunus dulcis TaxID=3755 RepID=A0AAD4USL9_PRUDU|nr:hypothetical protein L3X38_045524 [Prunus dulcis]
MKRLWRCKRLEQLPDLPSSKYVFVDVNDCTSLKRLSDPSKLSEGANVYDFRFSCFNCFRLVEEEGWINNRIFAMIMRFSAEVPHDRIIWPGSEIPDWFHNQSVGDSIIVEPPLPPQTCSDWVGIALCVVFEDSEHLKRLGYILFQILCPWERNASSSYQLSFEGFYLSKEYLGKKLKTSSIIKKCGARMVYKRDLEEFSRILKIPMPAVYGYDDEAGPIDN